MTKSELSRCILAILVALGAPAARGVAPPPPLCPYPGQTAGLTCLLATPVAPLLPATQPKYVNELPQPIFYVPDQTDPAFDYYEIFSAESAFGLASPATPFSAASLSAATVSPAGTLDTWGLPLPAAVNKVWLGLVNPLTPTQRLLTEVWGYGQQNNPAFPLNGAATYPAMSFRATKGKPVKVMWVNKLPNVHMLCKNPLNASSPCGIDRTLMGTKFGTGVTQFGGTQQPDNAMVVHLHGGEIPPDSDGFAELWFGNATTAAAYRAPVATAGLQQNIDPPLLLTNAPANGILPAAVPPPWVGNSTPSGDTSKAGVQTPFAPVLGSLVRPTGDSMIYNYPMVQEAATIWYHDHALGKTRVNVVAGPAGYFHIQDPVVDVALWGALPDAATGYAWGDCTNAGILAGNCRDVPIVLQDRSFNADGSINFPNGLGQITKNKFNPLSPGPNPSVHPQWVPEYFGDMSVVNGITWPKLTVGQQAYRFRLLDGSNARCYTLSLATAVVGGVVPTMTIIGSDQGYMQTPAAATTLTMCPGERYEVVIDFSKTAPGTVVNLVNTAGAPFPAGPTPQTPGGPYAFLANMMTFNVVAKGAAAGFTVPANWATAVQASVTNKIAALTAVPAPPVGPFVGVAPPTNPYTYILNEVADPLTKAPLRVQIDGKAFEDAVDSTPTRGAVQYWDIVNTTVDAHPMHLHLVQFKVIGRWTLDMNKYVKAAITPNALTGGITVNKAINPMAYVMGLMRAPEPGEGGFKDTAKSFPGELLRVVAKWDGGWADLDPVNAALTPFGKNAPTCIPAPLTDLANNGGCKCVQQPTCATTPPLMAVPPVGNAACSCQDLVTNATGLAPADGLCDIVNGAEVPIWAVPAAATCGATFYNPYFQPVTSGPYVWHCHIVDHEDNEMMRPTLVIP